MKKKTILMSSIVCATGIFIFIVAFFATSFAVPVEDIVKLGENTEQTYNIQVTYDGIDAYGVTSSNTTKANVKSNYIEVEDCLPNGLEFVGVNVQDAVERDDLETKCSGELVTLYDSNGWYEDGNTYYSSGVKYEKDKRKISYTIKNLEAGCSLTVEVKTKTSKLEENRMDIFHYAKAKEGNIFSFTNKNHAYVGSDNVEQYKVSYELEGEIPEEVTVPETELYSANQKVKTMDKLKVNGYKFIGWTTDDVALINDEFKMPENDVVLKGVFQKDKVTPKYKVTYQIDGVVPEGYQVPKEKVYYEKENVRLDSLSAGERISSYEFQGWTTEDTAIKEDYFKVTKDTVIHGKFEKIKYKVSYEFDSSIKPDNAIEILPQEEYYEAGEIVTLKQMDNVGTYEFQGWSTNNTFEMPKHDVIVLGRWQEPKHGYNLDIKVKPTTLKQYFKENEEILYEIEVTNTTYFPVEDIVVKEYGDHFIEKRDNYEVSSPHIATIKHLDPYQSISVYAKYTVTNEEQKTIKNTVELVSAKTSDKRYTVNPKKASFEISLASKLTICNEGSKKGLNRTFQYQITGVKTKYSSWIRIQNDGCKTIFLSPGEYQIKQVPVQEYRLNKVTGAITKNNKTFTCKHNKDYKITFQNEFRKK